MSRLRTLWREMFDIRPGEHLRTWAMFFYLLCVLFAYYILKPVSRSMFLTKFDIDKLPSLYIVIAAFGGVLAYLYSKLAAKTSLRVAVFWVMALSVLCLVGIWSAIGVSWMIYVLNIFVSLFSICLVSQGWLVASNLFDAREAKRVYPLLGMGMVIGAAFGGEFTNRTALIVGTRNLLLASAGMVILAYVAFRVAASQSRTLEHARGGERAETDFSFTGMIGDIARTRHLQVIVAIMVMMYLVDTMVEYQFQVMAAAGHKGDQLTAFFGQFYGIYLNLTEFLFQLFVTAAVVRRFGVGGTLQIAPVGIMLSSIATAAAPGITSAGAVRLAEASTRYTLNRTGMELLYMPLPRELRNRIKAFIDICVDRLSRGIAGVILLFLTASVFDLGVRGIAVVVMCLCVPWCYFAYLARREYISTVRKRMESRRLDIESARITVTDRATIRLLENAATGASPRQAAYALGLLNEAPNYDSRPLLRRLAASPAREVRDKVFGIAAAKRDDGLLDAAVEEIRKAQQNGGADLALSAVPYALQTSPDRVRLTAELLDDDPSLAAGALEALRSDTDLAQDLISREWLDRNARSADSRRRALAAMALGVRGDQGSEWLYKLLEDPDASVARAAIRAAGLLHNRAYLHQLVNALGNPQLRGETIGALSVYGESICGFLSDVLLDDSEPVRGRRQIPRVLKNIAHQRSVDVLLRAVGHPDLSIRAGVLKALNRLRETSPGLNFEDTFVTGQILTEARLYYELNAALAPFRDLPKDGRGAARLLARTIEERLQETLERLFRLLGLRYPPREIYTAYLAVSKNRGEEHTAALEFLDNVLERNIKRILLPLLDAPEHVLERGRELFGVDVRSAEDAIRDLIRSRDPWLAACAMAAAAELKLRGLAPEIAHAAAEAEGDVSEVARCAEASLAA